MTPTRRVLLLIMLLAIVGVAAWAQTPDIDGIDAGLKQQSDRIQQISDQLDAGDVPEATLEQHLQDLLADRDEIQADAKTLNAAADEPSKRLGDLGPPPAEGEPAESADIAKMRTSLGDEVTRLTGLAKEAELSLAAIDRLISRIRSLQGAHFVSRITERSVSPFSSELWTNAAADLPPAINLLNRHVADWWQGQRESGNRVADRTLVVAALAAALALLMLPRWSHWRRFEATLDEKTAPSLVDKRRRVAERTLSRGLLVAGAGALLYAAAIEVGLVEQAGRSFALRLFLGPAVVAFGWNYSRTVFSLRHPEWRLAQLDSKPAGLLRILFAAIIGLFVADRILAAGFGLSGAGIELTLAQSALGSSLFALLLWFSLSPGLWPKHDVLRAFGRVLAILILGAVALAYIRWANFVFHRCVLLALFLVLVWSVRVLSLWGLSRLPLAKPPGGDAAAEDDDTNKEPLGFWLKLALDLNLLALSLPGFLLIVGFDWLDIRRWFGLLGSGIRIGEVTVSITAILTGVVVFLLVSVGTHWATKIVDEKLLQRTRLDAGERNSIMTLVNYAGVVAAVLIALPIVGVGFTKLAVVAGALSVGIGFGLQSIVSNFVSGLILLFERPIKVGDWVVVPSGEGYVKNIGARATEIQTFDRASILIPNSELVTSAVQNWFYKSKLGRLRVNVGVSYGSDPEQVRDLLLDCAKNHSSISTFPAASVRWTDFGESSLDFQLRAYIRDVDDSYTVRSDLRFAIFKAFKDAGVRIPFPQRDLHVRPKGTLLGDSDKADP
jgi:potassium efflux system protein